jgi:hypothetical protein
MSRIPMSDKAKLIEDLRRNAAYYKRGADIEAGELLTRAADMLSALGLEQRTGRDPEHSMRRTSI